MNSISLKSLWTTGLALAFSAVLTAQADNNWTNNAGGLWEGATNWSLGTVPSAPDTVSVGVHGNYTVTLGSSAVNAFPTTLTNSNLYVWDMSLGSPGPTLNINFTNAATMKVNASVLIGNGTLNVNTPNGGIQSAYLTMGYAPMGLTGTLSIQAGTMLGAQPDLGYDVGSLSILNVSTGGVYTFNSSDSRFGQSGTALVNINGGTFNWNGTGLLGVHGTSTGIVTLTSGSLAMSLNTVMVIGSALSGEPHVYGKVVVSNGSFVDSSGDITIGTGPQSRGEFQLLGGTVTNSSRGNISIGSAAGGGATGSVLIAGGTWVENKGWDLGALPNNYGLATVSGGTLQYPIANSKMIVGAAADAKGELDITGGSVLFANDHPFVSPWIEVGMVSNSSGRIYVTGGLLSLADESAGLVVGTNANAKSASVVLEGGRVELGQINIGLAGVLSNRTGGLLAFLGSDTVLGSGAKIVDGGTLSYKNYNALTVSVAAAKFNIVSGSGLQLDTSTNFNITGTYLLTNAAGSFKDLSLTGNGARWQSDSLLVDSTAALRVTNAVNAHVASVVTNLGMIRVDNSTVTWDRPLVNSGRYISDPSTSTFTSNVSVTASGTLEGGVGDVFDFKKSLIIQSTNNIGFNLASSVVSFSGGGSHTNAVTGGDFGTNLAVYPNANFTYGTLTLASATDQLYFVSGGFTNGLAGSNALYVTQLNLFNNSGVPQSNLVTSLHSPFNIYYLDSVLNPGNAYLNDQTFSLVGGGELMPFIPEPSVLTLLVLGAGAMLAQRRFFRSH